MSGSPPISVPAALWFRLVLYSCYGVKTYSLYNDPELCQMGVAPILGQEALPSPRAAALARMRDDDRVYFVKTHEMPDDDSPAVCLVRDGRDALVSHARLLAHRERRRTPLYVRAAGRFNGSDPFERILERLVCSGQWQRHVLAWNASSGATTVVRFEQLLENPGAVAAAACERLSPCLAPTGGALPPFATLRRRWPEFFRRGQAGSWRDEMSEAVHERFWHHNRDGMASLGYGSARDAVE